MTGPVDQVATCPVLSPLRGGRVCGNRATVQLGLRRTHWRAEPVPVWLSPWCRGHADYILAAVPGHVVEQAIAATGVTNWGQSPAGPTDGRE